MPRALTRVPGPKAAPARAPFPASAFYGGLGLFAALALLFRVTDLDLHAADFFYRSFSPPWPGRAWAWSEALYRWGPWPADACGTLGFAAFLLSFTSKRLRPWRGPGLYLGLLLLAGPGLLSNLLAKNLAGRPRPVETLGYGGLWEFHRPFQFGVPGRGASFLSGHAANAWYFLGLFFLFPARSWGRRLFTALALAFGFAMCLARVSQGAHWLSDTLLIGAGLWTLAAGLSPLIHRQPSAALFRRASLRWALLGLGLACLSLSRVSYEERHFSGLDAPSADAAAMPPAFHSPTHRDLPYPGRPPKEVDVDLTLSLGDLDVRFDPLPAEPAGSPAPGPATLPLLPLTLDEVFQGQGLPPARESLDASPLGAGGQFQPGPAALAVRFVQGLRGPWFGTQDRLRLGLPAGLEVDARLRDDAGAINIAPFPAGRRVLLSGLPAGCAPPDGFRPFGAADWTRDGKAPLISLDLTAAVLRFDQP